MPKSRVGMTGCPRLGWKPLGAVMVASDLPCRNDRLSPFGMETAQNFGERLCVHDVSE